MNVKQLLALAAGGGLLWLARRRSQEELVERRLPTFYREKVCLITGASSGIGAEFARQLAGCGARVAIAARREEKLHEVAGEIAARTEGMRVDAPLVLRGDVTDPADRARWVDSVLAEWGRFDMLVNNAGITRGQRFAEIPPDEIDHLLDVNLRGLIHLTHLVAPHMIDHHSGLIVNVASIAGRMALPYITLYAASKYGIVGFSEALRRELQQDGIWVMTLLPGFTSTEMVKEETQKKMAAYGVQTLPARQVVREALIGAVLGRGEVMVAGPMMTFAVQMNRILNGIQDMLVGRFLVHAMSELAITHSNEKS